MARKTVTLSSSAESMLNKYASYIALRKGLGHVTPGKALEYSLEFCKQADTSFKEFCTLADSITLEKDSSAE